MNEEQAQAIQEAFSAAAEFVRDAWASLVKAMQGVYAWFHNRYTEAGAIYGDTHEGMIRWYGELAAIARLRQETDVIEQRHGMLVVIQRMRL